MIVFDTETTGLLKPNVTELWLQPFITEIYLCKLDKNFIVVDEYETFLKPLVPIPEEITKITGITNEMVSGAPSFIEIYPDLCEFFNGEQTVFAHNCTFDIGMLKIELSRHNLETKFPWPVDQRCTVELSFPIKNKRLSLEKLYKLATGKKLVDAHRAKNDVLPLVECIEWLFDQGLA